LEDAKIRQQKRDGNSQERAEENAAKNEYDSIHAGGELNGRPVSRRFQPGSDDGVKRVALEFSDEHKRISHVADDCGFGDDSRLRFESAFHRIESCDVLGP